MKTSDPSKADTLPEQTQQTLQEQTSSDAPPVHDAPEKSEPQSEAARPEQDEAARPEQDEALWTEQTAAGESAQAPQQAQDENAPPKANGQPKKKSSVTKSKTRRRVGTWLIAAGVVCMVVTAVYQLSTYPWSILSVKYFGAEVSSSMPDPDPLPYEYRFYDPQQDYIESVPDEVPRESVEQAANRPVINLRLIGSVKIPFLQVSENLLEGADTEQLYGIGHVPGTAMPGEQGNCVISGHRGYVGMHPFMYLPQMRVGDKVMITVDEQVYTYELYDMFTVGPADSWVMQPKSEEETHMLTMITCTPIPTYTERYICRAKLVDSSPV